MARYRLGDVKKLISNRQYHVTLQARQDALDLGFDSEDVRNCVLALDHTHFYKSMTAEKAPGLWQDVYKIRYGDFGVYLKLQINFADTAVIISFKEDTS